MCVFLPVYVSRPALVANRIVGRVAREATEPDLDLVLGGQPAVEFRCIMLGHLLVRTPHRSLRQYINLSRNLKPFGRHGYLLKQAEIDV